MQEITFLIETAAEGYTAKALGASIITQAESIEELKDMIHDAVKCHFESDKFPQIINFRFLH